MNAFKNLFVLVHKPMQQFVHLYRILRLLLVSWIYVSAVHDAGTIYHRQKMTKTQVKVMKNIGSINVWHIEYVDNMDYSYLNIVKIGEKCQIIILNISIHHCLCTHIASIFPHIIYLFVLNTFSIHFQIRKPSAHHSSK
jgi:hypothetical protein